jgi:hypothetical protein
MSSRRTVRTGHGIVRGLLRGHSTLMEFLPGQGGNWGGNVHRRSRADLTGSAGKVILGDHANDWFREPAHSRLAGTGLEKEVGWGGAPGGILIQAPLNQRPDIVRHLLQRRRSVDYPVDQGSSGPAAEGPLTGSSKRQDRAEAENVARRPDHAAFGLLGRHESGRPYHQPGAGQRAVLGGA